MVFQNSRVVKRILNFFHSTSSILEPSGTCLFTAIISYRYLIISVQCDSAVFDGFKVPWAKNINDIKMFYQWNQFFGGLQKYIISCHFQCTARVLSSKGKKFVLGIQRIAQVILVSLLIHSKIGKHKRSVLQQIVQGMI